MGEEANGKEQNSKPGEGREIRFRSGVGLKEKRHFRGRRRGGVKGEERERANAIVR